MAGFLSCKRRRSHGAPISEQCVILRPDMDTAPSKGTEEGIEAGRRLQMLLQERMFTSTPLAMASYPAIALRLRRADPALLAASLSIALGRHREAAGRIQDSQLLLTDEGVPFTVVESSSPSAPAQVDEQDLPELADFRRPARVICGLEPLVTVKLTRFRDGSAILALCRSHAIMDGSSVWAFFGDWARAARGEEMVAGRARNLHEKVPDERELAALWEERFDERMPRLVRLQSALMKSVMRLITPTYDALFLAGWTGDLDRPRVSFSDEELASIKLAATPPPGSAGEGEDSWVSTQEALSAYLLLVAGRRLLPVDSKGRVAATFLMDPRKALGMRSNEMFGSGVTFVTMSFDGLLQMSLWEVAATLHRLAAKTLCPEELKMMWRMSSGCSEAGVEFALFSKMTPRASEYDLNIWLNNQSKRELPDFGAEAAGGRAEAAVSNAGPTLVFPRQGGVDVLLDRASILKLAKTKAQRDEVVADLRSSLPKAPAEAGKAVAEVEASAAARRTMGGA